MADEDETNSHVIRRSCCCLLYGCRTTGRPCILKLSTLEISGLDQSQKPFAHTAALRIQLVEATPEGAAKVVRGTYGKHTHKEDCTWSNCKSIKAQAARLAGLDSSVVGCGWTGCLT